MTAPRESRESRESLGVVTLTMDATDAQGESLVAAEVQLTTSELQDIVSEWFARKVGMPMPVKSEFYWGWTPGTGPAAIVTLEPVGENVLPLRAPSEAARGRTRRRSR
jgi:hypothetical protein